MIIFFYVYGKARESLYLAEIIAEIHIVNIFKSKILIAINILNIKFFFINFRIRTFAINTIPEFSTNIRAIHKNIKIIKIVINFRKKKKKKKKVRPAEYYKRNPDTDEKEFG
jgi:hypothetical protein